MVWSLVMLRRYLKVARLTIRRDHYFVEQILNLVVTAGHLARWCHYLSGFEFDVLYCSRIKRQTAIGLFRLQTTGTDTDRIENDLSFAVIDTDTSTSTKMRLENHQQALAQVVEDNDYLKKKAAPTIADVLQHQAADPSCRQPPQSVSITDVEYTNDKNKQLFRVASINSAAQTLVPTAL